MAANPYISFTLAGASPSGKTEVWEVRTTSRSDLLGTIKWFGCWHQYSFFPAPHTVWHHACIDSVQDHTRWLNKRHRESRKTTQREGG